ncbi:MAG: helicase-exonuclease AddAB subunit AddB [Agathobacter sp.]|nr:helicase-exonuclease AddAB subunit AddB [Agathobacter sp.]
MALKLILGNSGSGKTEYMYEQVVKAAEADIRKNYLVVVPEQFTMQTQRKLVDMSTNHAIMNIDVLSFQRLAYRVFDELGKKDIKILEETGKSLVLRKIAQQKEEDLTVLRRNIHRMGYIGEVKSFISELMQYNISPNQLENCIAEEKFSKSLSSKLKDISIMYQGFREYLEGNYITQEELLHHLIKVADDSKILKDSVLVLDEFTGFTPVQVELLRKLMSICSEIMVSLTIDAKENFFHSKGMQELFHMSKKTISTLMDLAKETGCEVLEPEVITGGEKKRFQNAPALYFMEQNLFRTTCQNQLGETEEIQIFSLKNPKEELTWAARKINDLVQNHGYRYKDIAVVSGNVETYENYVEQICTKYDIPYFLDATKDVLFHPFIEFVRGILEVVENDFSYHAMMRLLRTGYCGFKQQEIDTLENYLLATGICGQKMWSKRWLRLPKNEKAYDLESLEAIRQKFMTDFEPVSKVFSSSTIEEIIKALYAYMVRLEVEQQLQKKEQQLLEEGEQIKSKEYGQIYRIVMDLFDKCIQVLGQESVSIQDFSEILDAGFEAAKVAVIPPGYDSVTIGDIERTRLNHVKVLLFLGVNEGVVPKSINQGGILSQFERDAMETAKIVLAPGMREQAFIQKFYLYLNMTKPSHQLCMTYSRVDREGKALRPSYLIRTMLHMFPNMKVQEIKELEEILNLSTPRAAREYFLTGGISSNVLKNGVQNKMRTPEWLALAKCFLESEDERIREKTKEIVDAFYYQYHHDPISHVVAEAIYGKNLEGSVTRLENFAKCAYSHYLTYGLKLREREESGFESVDMGNLYHTAVEIYSKKLAESSYDWFTIPDKIRENFAQSSMDEAILAYPNLSVYATAENAHMAERMRHIFKQTIWALTTQVRKGRFVPNEFEVAFSKADNLDALIFDLEQENQIRLRGRIDRLDTCMDDNRLYVKVIDYKSGKTKFDLIKLYHGMQLQLVVYMNAAMELEKEKHQHKEIIPGGLFYYHIDDPVIEITGEVSEIQIQEEVLKELKPDGLVNKEEAVYRAMDEEFLQKSNVIPVEIKKNGELSTRSSVASTEEFALLSEYVNHSIIQMGNEIYAGRIEASPFVEGQIFSCEYCPYKAVCGYDSKIKGYQERKPKKLDKTQILEQMELDNAIWREKKRNRYEMDYGTAKSHWSS